LTGRSGKQGVFAISTWAWYMFYTIQEIWILRDNSDKFRFEIVDYDIGKMNLHVQSLLEALNARGETTTDLLTNLVKGY
jgi:hypothetical protein